MSSNHWASPGRIALGLLAVLAVAVPSASAQIISVNGGFEAGLTGWTTANQLGSLGSFVVQSGTMSPVNGTTVPAPPGGLQTAMTDAMGPGSHVLYQDIVIPSTPVPGGSLQFDLFIGNRANAFFKPATLDFSTPALNQQARVDIITVTADLFSLLPGDVLFSAYQTNLGDLLVSGYNPIAVDLTSLFNAHVGETLRLRFAEVDNVNFFQMGVDNVVVTVPEPTSMILCGIGAIPGLILCIRRRHRRTITTLVP